MCTFEGVFQKEGGSVNQEVKAPTVLMAAEVFCEQHLDQAEPGRARNEGSFIRNGRLMACFSYSIPGYNPRLYIYEEVNPT